MVSWPGIIWTPSEATYQVISEAVYEKPNSGSFSKTVQGSDKKKNAFTVEVIHH